ncbi:DNA excision repair protein ERCC-6-like [Xenentodon cancila]
MLYKELHNKLYDYQRDGVSFLYGLYRDGHKGGVLADDMGLGKTIQVISFLSGMYDNELIKHTLLIMPTSLITNWIKEFAKWTPGMRVKEFHGTSKAERARSLEKVQRRTGVVITTYTMLINNWQQLSSHQGREFCWDYIILDEAHKIKNTSTKTAKSAYAIPSKNRILLTGTPVQNNLKEMWTLFDFACQGTLLGTAKTFKTEYENPITRAREKDATPGEKALGSRMSETLMVLIKPYFLRRTKSEVQKKKSGAKGEHSNNKINEVQTDQVTSGAVMPKLTRKNDLIVWTYLSAIQEDIYRQFIALDHIKELLLTSRSPLAELTILKKLCDHPRLLSAGATAKLGLDDNAAQGLQDDNMDTEANSITKVPDETLISESGKLVFLLSLLDRLRKEGHRTLVFAHYRKVLDIIERILSNRGFKVLRLDGTISQLAERERLITLFQTDKRYSVFLLTTQVGGVGITLTAANRVVIYDPSWNPATDAQAVDRAYRIGQTENVVIYRLITCGTVEEKIYRRQVFKDSLIRQNTGDKKNPFRYFSRQELKELFTLEDTRSSSTQLQLQALHSRHRRTDPELDEHIAHLHAMDMFGISDHDLMFSVDVNHDEALEDQEEHNYIEGRVQKAQELVKAESELQMQLAESMASSTEPAWLRQSLSTNNRQPSHEKKSKNPKTSPSEPPANCNFRTPPVEVDLDQSGSEEASQQNPCHDIIDLTVDISPPCQESERAAADTANGSVVDLMDGSTAPSERCTSPLRVTEDDNAQVNEDSHSEKDPYLATPLQHRRLSVLQQSDASFKAGTPTASAELESFNGNFNLQLEDSHNDILEDTETEEEEQMLLSQLQTNGSFNINKSLSQSQHRQTTNGCADVNESMNDSVVFAKKRKAAVIYDSEEEDEAELKSQLHNSFQVLGASTPKSEPLTSRKSMGGNASVVSHRSLLQSIIEDLDDQQDPEEKRDTSDDEEASGGHSEDENPEEEEQQVEGGSSEEDGNEEDDFSRKCSETEKEEDFIFLTCNESQQEETTGETLNSESQEEDEEEEETTGETLNTESQKEEEEEEVEGRQDDSVEEGKKFNQEKDNEDSDVLELNLDEVEEEEEEEDVSSAHSKYQLEVTNGETLRDTEEDNSLDDLNNLEDEEEMEMEKESDSAGVKSGEDTNSNLEDWSSEPELASGERLDPCTVEAAVESESYDSLVRKGKECYSQAKLEDALDFFLRAIDIKPGDPEVQFMTIQLYRQLSRRH